MKLRALVSLWLILFFLFGCAEGPEKPISHNRNPELKNSIVITIDLCPSKRPYERKLFKSIEYLGKMRGKPVPIAVSISGRWIEEHRKELREIKKMDLNIIWVNHSYSHPTDRDFLDNPKVDFKYEVEHNIKVMEKAGLKPSRYFRFPGLRHNRQRLKQLAALGYISVDTNAWLGKMHWWKWTVGSKIRAGSIILIHGNGNERPGVVNEFIDWLKQNKKYRIVPLDDFILPPKSLVGGFMPVIPPSGTPEAVRP